MYSLKDKRKIKKALSYKKEITFMSKGWFKQENPNETCYMWEAKGRVEYKTITGDDRIPTPTDLCNALNDHASDWEADSCPESDLSACLASRQVSTDLSDKRVEIPSGCYHYHDPPYDPGKIVPFELREENAINRGDFDKMQEDLTNFLNKKEVYTKNGIFYKRGYLLYGEPGEGKTTIIRQLVQGGPLKDALVFFVHQVPDNSFLDNLRKYENGRLKVFVYEELTTLVPDQRSSQKLLGFLDGETSIDNAVVIATTNYAHDLPGNIVDRPSRFDYLHEVKAPNEGEVGQLIKNFTGTTPEEIEVKDLIGLSTAAIKEVCVVSLMRDISISRAYEVFKNRTKVVSNNFSKSGGKSIGFKK